MVPVLDEEPNIAPLVDEIRSALEGRPFEIVYVDDGSTDGTWDAIAKLNAEDDRVRGVRLRSNAGKSAAYAAGFRATRGHLIATLDGDLQDDPKDLLPLADAVAAGDADMAVGWKTTGKSSPLTFILSKFANMLLRLITPLRLHDMNCPVRVMKKDAARGLDLRADHHRYIPLLAHARGFSVIEKKVANRPRQHGSTKYGGSKYFRSATALIGVGLYLRFGQRPMALFGGLGLIALCAGVAICAFVAIMWGFFGGDIDDDIPTLILGSVLILTGGQFVGLGLLGEIVVRRIRLGEGLRADVSEEL